MQPFRKNSKKHINMNAKKCAQKEMFHPFVKASLRAQETDDSVNNITSIPIPIVKPEALKQVILEINLLKNKN